MKTSVIPVPCNTCSNCVGRDGCSIYGPKEINGPYRANLNCPEYYHDGTGCDCPERDPNTPGPESECEVYSEPCNDPVPSPCDSCRFLIRDGWKTRCGIFYTEDPLTAPRWADSTCPRNSQYPLSSGKGKKEKKTIRDILKTPSSKDSPTPFNQVLHGFRRFSEERELGLSVEQCREIVTLWLDSLVEEVELLKGEKQ